MSSLAIQEAFLDLVPRFEKHSGRKVAAVWAGMADIRKRLIAGEAADAVIASAAAVDELLALGKLAVGSKVDIATSHIMVAVRAGAPKPAIGTTQALKDALAKAKTVGYSSGPSGVYLSGLFEKWGVPKHKIAQTPPGTPVGPLIARGEIEIGFQQWSELLPIPGLDIVGPLPDDIQLVNTFSGAVSAASTEQAAAKQLLEFLRSAESAPVLRDKGMEPAKK